MKDALIIEKAINEIIAKEFGSTRQLLEIHEVVYENDKPKVLRIDKERSDGLIIVYFPIKEQRFYLAIWLETNPHVSVCGVGTETCHSVYLRVISEDLNFQELAAFTKLQFSGGWSKGDIRKSGNSVYNFSALHFEPNPEPDEFEDKLKKLLDFLDGDKEGVTRLLAKAKGLIQVASVFHNGNTMLGGHHLDSSIVQRLALYNLEIDFDLYAEGNFFKN